MKKNSTLRLGLIVLFMTGCQTTEPGIGTDAGYAYFPLEEGRYVEYRVNEVRYTVSSVSPKSITYYLRELCGQPYTGTTGLEQFPMARYKKSALEGSWALDSVWTAYVLPDRAVRVENNTAFVKLAFPLAEGRTWNGNLLNNRRAESYEARYGALPSTSIQADFPGSVTIVQQDDSSIVSFFRRNEVYAPGVGLVYKEDIAWEYCQEPTCIGSGKIDTGTSRIMQLTRYGKE